MYVLVFNRAYFSFKASSVAVSIRLQSISYTINCILHTLPLSCVYMFRVDFVLLCCHLISYATNHSTNSHFMVMQWIQSNCTFVYSFHILFTVIWLYELKTRQWKMIYAAKPNKFNWLLYRNVSKPNILSIHEGILCWFTRNDDYFNQNFTSRFECEYQKTMNMLKKLWKCGFQNGCENNPQDFHQNWPRSDFR